MKRVTRDRVELEADLAATLRQLEAFAEMFDSGVPDMHRPISTLLRKLLHDGGRSRSLLGQLNMLNEPFVDSSFNPPTPWVRPGQERTFQVNVRQLWALSNQRGVAPSLGLFGTREVQFPEWWGMHVHEHFSRERIVLEVADTDGGAHTDPTLELDYHQLSRRETPLVRGQLDSAANPPRFAHTSPVNPFPVLVRAIAYEVLKTFVPGFNPPFPRVYGNVFMTQLRVKGRHPN